jgi:hypothetical protein
MDIRPTLGRKNLFFDFSFPNRKPGDEGWVGPILPGNRGTDFLEEYRPNVHFAEVQ